MLEFESLKYVIRQFRYLLLTGTALPGNERRLPNCVAHSKRFPDEILRVLSCWIGYEFGHLLNGGHPRPLVLMILS